MRPFRFRIGVMARIIACATTIGCAPAPAKKPIPKIPSPYPELGISIDNYPKVDGSTSAQPLQTLIACKVLGANYQWTHSKEDDTRYLGASDLLDFRDNPDYAFEKQPLCERINEITRPHGTHEAYVNLIEKRADFILTARAPSEDETALTEQRGVRLDPRPVASDAFVFLLNATNPVETLSVKQIRDIYSGRITDWRTVGGRSAAIRPYRRPRNSGSQELMRLVMDGRPMIVAPDLLLDAMMSTPFLAVSDNPDAIGYSFYYYHDFMFSTDRIKLCAVDGVLPNPETITARRYPLVTPVYVVIRYDLPPDAPARRLRDWLLGPTGQGIVALSGYVPVGEAVKVEP